MSTRSETITLRTTAREEMVDITHQVHSAVRTAGVTAGVVWIYSPHTTAGITIQENADPDVRADLLDHLRQLVPLRSDFRHQEGNSDAHVKCTLVGSSQAVPIEGGRVLLGTWQAVYFCEFDGPRARRVQLMIMGC